MDGMSCLQTHQVVLVSSLDWRAAFRPARGGVGFRVRSGASCDAMVAVRAPPETANTAIAAAVARVMYGRRCSVMGSVLSSCATIDPAGVAMADGSRCPPDLPADDALDTKTGRLNRP